MNKKNAGQYAFIAGLFFLVIVSASSLFYYQENRTSETNSSPEVGFSSLSPSGSVGGEILPASCESVPQVAHCINRLTWGENECIQYETLSCCVPNAGTPCESSPVCGRTQSNGTVQCNGSCSSTPPAPTVVETGSWACSDLNDYSQDLCYAGTGVTYEKYCDGTGKNISYDCYGIECGTDIPGCTNSTACNYNATATTDNGSCFYNRGACSVLSDGNTCGISTAATGTYDCNMNCSATKPAPPANPSYFGTSCSVSNSCGDTNWGTYDCGGVCSASMPPGICGGCKPGYGDACPSLPNACGVTAFNGTIQCDGVTCSSIPPPDPWWIGTNCSVSNSCGASNWGTYDCGGVCSATAPSESGCALALTFTGTYGSQIKQTTLNNVPANSTVTLNWTTSANATSCWASNGWSGWVPAPNTTGGSSPQTVPATTTFSMECWNNGGISTTGLQSVTVNVASPINGGWSNCSETACGTTGIMTCTNPAPSGGGLDCVGGPGPKACTNPPCGCTLDCSASANYCSGTTFTDSNGCGTNNCTGTRSCDYNWREVAP